MGAVVRNPEAIAAPVPPVAMLRAGRYQRAEEPLAIFPEPYIMEKGRTTEEILPELATGKTQYQYDVAEPVELSKYDRQRYCCSASP